MRGPKPRSGPQRQAPPVLEGPTVPNIIEAMERGRAALLGHLRDLALSMQGVNERTVYDGFCREWTPAYYLGARQLFHVHNFRSGLRATMFVGVNTLNPVILGAEEVAPEIRLMVAEASGGRGTKMVKVPLGCIEDVDQFMDLVRVKWEFVAEPSPRSHRQT